VLKAFAHGSVLGHPSGEGPVAVVWLHGWGRSGADFATAAALLGQSSLALDLPGFGGSPLPATAGGARLYAELVTPVLRELGQPVILVGHSFGGRIATVIAAEHPDLVRGLVLTGAPLLRRAPAARPPLRYRVVRTLHRWHLLSDAALERRRQQHGSADYRAASGLLRDILVTTVNESYDDELRRVTCPVRLVWGADDHDVPVRVAEDAAKLLAGPSTLTVVANVGHHTPLQAAGALVEAVRSLEAS
jgi:pimeloyl-ACP methyl ester carboxylesterase